MYKRQQANAGPDQTICLGQTTVLNASGGISYQWNTGQLGSSIVVSPNITTTYMVTITDGNGCSATDQVTVTVGNVDANAGADQTVCFGGTTTLTASGGTNYQWNTGATTQTITVSPTTSTNYTVTVSDNNGCSDTDNVLVTVGNATANAGPDQTICAGNSAVLFASGGTNFQWNTGATTQTLVVLPNVTTTYTVTVSDGTGCSATDAVIVNVTDVTAEAGLDQTICLGGSTTLTASGGTSYQWSNGATTASTTVAPGSTTTYTVTVSNANGCTDTDQVTVTVGSATANAGPDQTICAGSSATLSATGGTIFSWSNGASTPSILVSPTTTTTYTVTVSDANGCSATDAVQVIVGSSFANAGPDQTVCLGSTAVFTASGGTSYIWSNGATTPSISVNATTTTTYSVTVSDANGCTSTDSATLTIGNAVADAGANQIICNGSSTSLTATGGTNYQWSTGATTPTINVSPAATTIYSVTVSDNNGCSDTDEVIVTVGSADASAGPDQTICQGESAILNATGGVFYQWNTGATTQMLVVLPNVTTTYTVTVSDANGCSDTDEVTVFVSTVDATISPAETICLGGSTTLTAGGGTSYLWSNGATTASTTVAPASTTTYSVTVTNANGCTDVASTLVTVSNTIANITPDQTICLGESVNITASGGSSYLWNTGATTPNIFVTPTTTTVYNVTVSNGNGCTDVATMTVTVGNATAEAGPDQTVCLGNSATITATGGVFYQWNTGATTPSIVVTPNTTTTYTVTVTDNNGCSDSDNVTLNVGSAVAGAGLDQTICFGESATLTASGGINYQWSNGATTQTINVSPNSTTTYIVTVTDPNGCTDTDEVVVNVGSATAEAGPNQTICNGESTTLNASGGSFYSWSNGATTALITVSYTHLRAHET